MPVPSVGPLRELLQVEWGPKPHDPPVLIGPGATGSANALIVLRRTAFVPDAPDHVELPKQAGQALLRWAQDHDLGQVDEQVRAVSKRREYALDQFRAQGKHVARVLLTPEWRVTVGLGEKANTHELGLSLHGTYGWPVIPGSSLKGVTAAYAWDRFQHAAKGREVFRKIFGSPLPPPRAEAEKRQAGKDRTARGAQADGTAREEQYSGAGADRTDAQRGTVRFLDAFAAGSPVTVSVDVLTPHVKPYYDTTREEREGVVPHPPAEHHQPVPVQFLTVAAGSFAADLVGDTEQDIKYAAHWLCQAVEDLGVGAKTAAGYGYMKVQRSTG
ncbi:type III-B CRISPR module RAMP protein Cmr6 [Nocardiopsis algeriensis]|uniref:type III-B CRISPR module RAMP protein Cmr6 n=1 Tax=Nocardiopsis algeriensis TaxID=1478215 RepID=UPI003B4356C5